MLAGEYSINAKLLYGLLLNRTMLSQKSGWVSEDGNVYVIYTIKQMADDLDRSERTVKTALRELREETGATPDGRHAGDPFSRNTGASIGMEKHGVTALLNSAVKFDQAECPDGAVLDVMLHPSAVSGSDGADVIAGLVRSYFAAGGLMIQFNILNAEDLRKAQEEPEKYDDVQVRVCGWNNKFVNLSHEEQNAFIAQAEAQQ